MPQRRLKALVVGTGSIGRRHARNLQGLGVEVSGCDRDPTRLGPLVDELHVQGVEDLDVALRSIEPDAVIVCTPPVSHLGVARRSLEAGADVFVEKPVSHTCEGVLQLDELARGRGRIVQVGYNLRFHPGIRKLKELLADGGIGRPLYVHAECAQYLPDWRPWQAYQASYTANKAMGGGILLDASHEIDYVCDLFGRPRQVICLAGKVSRLEMDVEDCATLLLRFGDALHADIHLDCVQREQVRTCRIAGEAGTLTWDYRQNAVRAYSSVDRSWTEFAYEFAPNDMYIAEMQHFLHCIESRQPPAIGLADGLRALQVVEAARDWAELREAA
ncbi:MAG: Gfo/Idh/MocA family oxidoreductase [Planctomycetia bacterium]|nr:Gfo/Idh/MocA family oxidoreductase [Planctomycetia bacterium]